MRTLAAFRSWLSAVFRRADVERRIDEELQFHIENYVDDLLRAGIAPEEAQRRAHVEFGGIRALKEECRDAFGVRLVDELTADARYAFRQMRRSPVLTVIAVLSLALGIGANSAIFSLMETAVWKSAAVRDPERLALFSWVSGPQALMNSSWGNWRRTMTGGRASTSLSYPIYEMLRRQQQTFDTVFAFRPLGRVTAIVDGHAELVSVHLVSGNFYDGVGVAPIVGRAITADDDVVGGTDAVAVISDSYWARRFGRNPSAIGAKIRVNEAAVTVIGVNPARFVGLEAEERPDLFLPLNKQPLVLPWRYTRSGSLLDDPDYWWVLVMGRLKPRITRTQAQSAIEVPFQQAIAATLPNRGDRDQPHIRLLPGARGQDNLREVFATPLLTLGALTGVVLLMTCANVASLLLARAVARRREVSLRLALGAGRWRIARQLLTEALALGLCGGALGLMLAYWTRHAIPSVLLPSWAPSEQFKAEFDIRVLLLTTAVSIATAVLFGLAPIWHSLAIDINAALKDGGTATAARAQRGRWIVAFQVSLSVLLLFGAGLFVRTLSNLRSVSIGFNPERVLLFTIDPPRARYRGSARKAFFERVVSAIGAIPGVESASLSEMPLLSGGSSGTRVGPDGRIPTPKDNAWVNDVSHRFFETMRVPILAGRSFDEHDRETSQPVVIVNQRFAQEFFPGRNPIGRTLRNNGALYQVVGICADTVFGDMRRPISATFYRHFTQSREPGAMTFEVRTAVSETALMDQVRTALNAIDDDVPVFDVRTQTQQIDALLSRERLFVVLTSAFGVLAVLLASLGIYGLLAHAVSRRTNEIGLRIALGANRRDVHMMILHEALVLAGVGAAIGAVGAVALGRYIRAMLFGVTTGDPMTIGTAMAAMMLVAVLAGWIPARNASKLDPSTALRHE
jgi:predicted permease